MRLGAKLSIDEIRQHVESVSTARAVGRQLTTDEEMFLDWLLARASQWPPDILDFMKKLAVQVGKLDFATEAARTVILADIAEYPMMTPDNRQKAKDRFYKALTSKAPSEGAEAKRARQSLELSGHGFERPTRFGE